MICNIYIAVYYNLPLITLQKFDSPNRNLGFFWFFLSDIFISAINLFVIHLQIRMRVKCLIRSTVLRRSLSFSVHVISTLSHSYLSSVNAMLVTRMQNI